MKKSIDSWTDRHGRSWPGPAHLDGREVADVSLNSKLVQLRLDGISFEWVSPDDFPPPGAPKRVKRRKEKP